MKKNYFLVFVLLLTVLSGCLQEKVAVIPLCNVQGNSYFTNNPEEYVEEIEESYQYYGIIHLLSEYDDGVEQKDLSTNYEGYMNKEIYVNKEDMTYIYIKYENNKYLKLYFDSK